MNKAPSAALGPATLSWFFPSRALGHAGLRGAGGARLWVTVCHHQCGRADPLRPGPKCAGLRRPLGGCPRPGRAPPGGDSCSGRPPPRSCWGWSVCPEWEKPTRDPQENECPLLPAPVPAQAVGHWPSSSPHSCPRLQSPRAGSLPSRGPHTARGGGTALLHCQAWEIRTPPQARWLCPACPCQGQACALVGTLIPVPTRGRGKQP